MTNDEPKILSSDSYVEGDLYMHLDDVYAMIDSIPEKPVIEVEGSVSRCEDGPDLLGLRILFREDASDPDSGCVLGSSIPLKHYESALGKLKSDLRAMADVIEGHLEERDND